MHFGSSWALLGTFWGAPGAVWALLHAYLLVSMVVLAALDARMLYDDQLHFLFPSSFPLPPPSSPSLSSSSSLSAVIFESIFLIGFLMHINKIRAPKCLPRLRIDRSLRVNVGRSLRESVSAPCGPFYTCSLVI